MEMIDTEEPGELERSTLQDSDEYSSPAPLPLDQLSRKENSLKESSNILSVQDNKSPLPAQPVYTTDIKELNVYSEVQEPKELPPPSKTSAAAQLDELMAHLSEMQDKVGTSQMVKPPGPTGALVYLSGTQLCIPLLRNSSKLSFIFPD
uniref:Uncharacterized protein n=1 Tax=Prolemur simus TaxID=1328070 RepID=A0A8C8ZB91_PROSS